LCILKKAYRVSNENLIKIIAVYKNSYFNKEQKMDQCGCPGQKTQDFRDNGESQVEETGKRVSQLRQWPIQMHLVSPTAPYFQGADVLLTSDCVAYALGDYHKDFLKGNSLAIACPKLDEGQDVYLEKIKSWIDDAQINSLTLMIMQVPCCMGLAMMAKKALEESSRKVPVKQIVISLQGEILSENWVKHS
jgi:hypothetical protein